MRVLVLTSLYPLHHVGGYELACRDVVDRWRSAGHAVTVLTSDTELPGMPRVQPGGEAHVRRLLQLYDPPAGLTAPRRRDLPRVELANHVALTKVWRDARPDVVSVWHLGGLSLSLVRQLGLRRRPVVFVVADDWMWYARLADPVVGRLARVLPEPRRLGEVVFCSAALRDEIAATMPWAVADCPVVWLGVDPVAFPVVADDDREWHWRVLFVGRVAPEKGVAAAVRALPHLPPEATLDIVGRGAQSEVTRLQTIAKDLGLHDRVRFDAVDRSELAARYRAADVFVFPSEWNEPFGIAPLEAMACATPVVATGTGGSGEYLVHEQNCLLVGTNDPDGIAAAIGRIAGDRALRRRLVTGGRSTAGVITTDRLAASLWKIHAAATRQ